MTKSNPLYSVIVPVFNEAGNVVPLYNEIHQVMHKLGMPFEMIFVDDASTDATAQELKVCSPLTVIRMRANSGQSSALDAGMKHATGDILITMDGDGQDDPSHIPAMLALLESEKADVVCAWRHDRKDSFFTKSLSAGWKSLRRILVDDGIHDAGSQFRVYRREALEDLDLYGELHRFIPALLKWRGFRVTEMKVTHRARTHGKSKYTWSKVFKGFSDMLYMWFMNKYATRPVQLFGTVGVLSILAGTVILAILAYMRIFFAYQLSDKIWPLVGFFFFLIGAQMLTTGVLAANMLRMDGGKKYFVARVEEY